jgi:hypothetical protein
MDAISRPPSGTSGGPVPAEDARDFVSVDDSGAFSYHRSQQDLVAAFEYVAEAACIIDRSGNSYDLAMDPDRHLILGPEHGPVEFHWLRQALTDAWEVHPEEHPLRRLYPSTLNELVSGLFETLQLEQGYSLAADAWTFDVGDVTVRRSTLKDVDRRLAREDELDSIRVRDPLGHTYRPVRHRKHWYLPAGSGFLVYEERPQR